MKKNANKAVMVTNGGCRNAGLFSYVGQVIGNLHVSDIKEINMWVNVPHSPYLDLTIGKNCWDYYFLQPYGLTETDLCKYEVVDEQEWFDGKLDTITPNFTEEIILRARELTKKYIKPALNIEKKINDFKVNVIQTENYGSIHFRGTDHHYNAYGTFPIIPQDIYFQYIYQLLTKYEKVLICSDQQDFINNAVTKFGNNRVVYYPSTRSTDHIAIHYSNISDKYKTGEDVVIESILMGQSKFLVRTCSGVTHFSIFYNQDPEFKFINLDEIYYGRKH